MPENIQPTNAQSQQHQGIESLTTEEFLSLIGKRIRAHRTGERMSRKRLAEVSGVSERYLAQLEAGQGNMSIALLRKVTKAIGLPLNLLLADGDLNKASASDAVDSNNVAAERSASLTVTESCSANQTGLALDADPQRISQSEKVPELS